jgi:hypothetical protein
MAAGNPTFPALFSLHVLCYQTTPRPTEDAKSSHNQPCSPLQPYLNCLVRPASVAVGSPTTMEYSQPRHVWYLFSQWVLPLLQCQHLWSHIPITGLRRQVYSRVRLLFSHAV